MKNKNGINGVQAGQWYPMVSCMPKDYVKLTSLILIALGMCASNSWAILMSFEESDGYHLGNLVGQPNSGTQWIGTSSASSFAPLQVVAGQGVGGSNALQVQSSLAENSAYRYVPSNADLGGTFSVTSSVVSLSFELRWDAVNTTSTGVGRFYIGAPTIGGTPAVLSLDWYSNGRIGFNDGVFQYVSNAAGSTFVATAGVYYNVSVTLDYAAKTYVLSVNDVTQMRNGNDDISFRNPSGALNNIIDITTLNNQSATFQGWAIDNINYALVPEPSVAGLAIGASLLFGVFGLRKGMVCLKAPALN